MTNKAKTFCYVSLGILALVAAFQLGASVGRGGIVDPSLDGVVSFDAGENRYHSYCLLASGDVWDMASEPAGWFPQFERNPPVPVSGIKFWSYWYLVTHQNEGYYFDHLAGEWVSLGICPGVVGTSVGRTEPSTWGRVKAEVGSPAYSDGSGD